MTKFVGTAGVGYTFFETRDAFDDTGILIEEGQRESSVVFRGTLDFEHAFTETTKLINLLAVETGADNTYVQNDLSVQVKINTVLALAVGIQCDTTLIRRWVSKKPTRSPPSISSTN